MTSLPTPGATCCSCDITSCPPVTSLPVSDITSRPVTSLPAPLTAHVTDDPEGREVEGREDTPPAQAPRLLQAPREQRALGLGPGGGAGAATSWGGAGDVTGWGR